MSVDPHTSAGSGSGNGGTSGAAGPAAAVSAWNRAPALHQNSHFSNATNSVSGSNSGSWRPSPSSSSTSSSTVVPSTSTSATSSSRWHHQQHQHQTATNDSNGNAANANANHQTGATAQDNSTDSSRSWFDGHHRKEPASTASTATMWRSNPAVNPSNASNANAANHTAAAATNHSHIPQQQVNSADVIYQAADFGPANHPNVRWYYLDPQRETQGPFSSNDMRAWYENSYFDLKLPVQCMPAGVNPREANAKFIPLGVWFLHGNQAFLHSLPAIVDNNGRKSAVKEDEAAKSITAANHSAVTSPLPSAGSVAHSSLLSPVDDSSSYAASVHQLVADDDEQLQNLHDVTELERYNSNSNAAANSQANANSNRWNQSGNASAAPRPNVQPPTAAASTAANSWNNAPPRPTASAASNNNPTATAAAVTPNPAGSSTSSSNVTAPPTASSSGPTLTPYQQQQRAALQHQLSTLPALQSQYNQLTPLSIAQFLSSLQLTQQQLSSFSPQQLHGLQQQFQSINQQRMFQQQQIQRQIQQIVMAQQQFQAFIQQQQQQQQAGNQRAFDGSYRQMNPYANSNFGAFDGMSQQQHQADAYGGYNNANRGGAFDNNVNPNWNGYPQSHQYPHAAAAAIQQLPHGAQDYTNQYSQQAAQTQQPNATPSVGYDQQSHHALPDSGAVTVPTAVTQADEVQQSADKDDETVESPVASEPEAANELVAEDDSASAVTSADDQGEEELSPDSDSASQPTSTDPVAATSAASNTASALAPTPAAPSVAPWAAKSKEVDSKVKSLVEIQQEEQERLANAAANASHKLQQQKDRQAAAARRAPFNTAWGGQATSLSLTPDSAAPSASASASAAPLLPTPSTPSVTPSIKLLTPILSTAKANLNPKLGKNGRRTEAAIVQMGGEDLVDASANSSTSSASNASAPPANASRSGAPAPVVNAWAKRSAPTSATSGVDGSANAVTASAATTSPLLPNPPTVSILTPPLLTIRPKSMQTLGNESSAPVTRPLNTVRILDSQILPLQPRKPLVRTTAASTRVPSASTSTISSFTKKPSPSSVDGDSSTNSSAFGGPTMSSDFENWCQEKLSSISGANGYDVSLPQFLMTVNSDEEVRQYIHEYLGNGDKIDEFADEFCQLKAFEQGDQKQTTKEEDDGKKRRRKKNQEF